MTTDGPISDIQLSFSFSKSFRCLGWQLSVGFLHSESAQLTTQRYLPDRNNEECRHFGDTLLIFQSPDHMRETLCLTDLWINLCTIWTNQAPVSWNTGLPRLCLQDGCRTPRSGHTGSSGQWLGSALPADGIRPCPYSSDSLFNCVPGAHFRRHILVPTCGILQALEPSRWTWIFLTPLRPAHPLLYFPSVGIMPTLDSLDPCCLSAVQATNVSSQVFLDFTASSSLFSRLCLETAWGLPGSGALFPPFPLIPPRDFQLHLEWTPTQTFKASSAAPGYVLNLISHTCSSAPFAHAFLLVPPNTFSTWAV